jgi:hypothetical protein
MLGPHILYDMGFKEIYTPKFVLLEEREKQAGSK